MQKRQRFYCQSVPFILLSLVVTGLDNIEVGLTDNTPADGAAVLEDSYALCGSYDGPVSPSQIIVINCALFPQRFRYVLVLTLDRVAERLCLAEVAVFAGI